METSITSVEADADALEGPQLIIERVEENPKMPNWDVASLMESAAGIDEYVIAALGLEDEDIAEGQNGKWDDDPMDEDICEQMEMKIFRDDQLDGILEMQDENNKD